MCLPHVLFSYMKNQNISEIQQKSQFCEDLFAAPTPSKNKVTLWTCALKGGGIEPIQHCVLGSLEQQHVINGLVQILGPVWYEVIYD